jgi:hypothetical protein
VGAECKTESDRVAVATIGGVLTDTIDMTHNAQGQGKPFDIAAISGVEYDHVTQATDPYGFGDSQELILTWVDGRAILSAPQWDRASWNQRLNLAQAALAIFACIPKPETPTLHWLFSGKDVARDDADDLLSCWQDDGAPPVISIIDFLVEDRTGQKHIRTIGLSAFVGHEVEAIVGEDQAELARMVGRLAQEVLLSGPVTYDSITGPDNGKYSLKYCAGIPVDGSSIQIFAENT